MRTILTLLFTVTMAFHALAQQADRKEAIGSAE
jgi:hypothetical protein